MKDLKQSTKQRFTGFNFDYPDQKVDELRKPAPYYDS